MSNSPSPAAQSATSGTTSGSRRILLTGVTGFLGQAVLRSLLVTTEDVHVTAVVRPKGSVTGGSSSCCASPCSPRGPS